MYTSLDRADIAIEQDGARIAVQTDHRDARAIEDEYELSVIFALARALNPVRTGQFERARFTFMHRPPEAFLELLLLAGAEVELMGSDATLAGAPDDERVDALAGAAMRRLGGRLFAERNLPADEQGLLMLQAEYARRATESGGIEGDEGAYWACVVELGAATGEVMCSRGARWVRDPKFFGIVPFMISKGGGLSNVFDKVERFFAHGVSEQPAMLLRMMEDDGVEAGEVMYNLRPHDWHGREHAWFRPLLDRVGELKHSRLPIVALVHDLPNTTRTMPADLDAAEASDLEGQARANLARLDVQVEEVEAAGVPIVITAGSYYASEKILDREHMRAMAARLGSELLLASVPVKGMLFVANAMTTPEAVEVFRTITNGQFQDAPPNQRVSSELILVSREGDVVGVARATTSEDEDLPPAVVDEEAAEAPAKSFWARLFGQ